MSGPGGNADPVPRATRERAPRGRYHVAARDQRDRATDAWRRQRADDRFGTVSSASKARYGGLSVALRRLAMLPPTSAPAEKMLAVPRRTIRRTDASAPRIATSAAVASSSA